MKKKSILKNAKKLLALVPFASAALIMVGCAKKTEPKPTTHTDPIVTTTEKPTTTEHKDDPIVKTYANVGELMEEKASSIYSLLENYVSDTFETSTGISYDAENIIFSAVDVDETATTLTNADYTFAYKNGETERKYFTATAEFNEVSLADLADGKTTNFYLEDATTKSQQTYDAKEKQNDTDFLANLYSQNNDKVFKTYTAETFEEDEMIKYYLIRLTINYSLNVIKHEKKQLVDNEYINNLPDTSNSEERNENKEEIYNCICLLKDNYKTIIILYYYEKYSLKQISNILKISESNASTRLNRAREKLKKIIEERKYKND